MQKFICSCVTYAKNNIIEEVLLIKLQTSNTESLERQSALANRGMSMGYENGSAKKDENIQDILKDSNEAHIVIAITFYPDKSKHSSSNIL